MFRKKFRPVYIVLNTWSLILLFKLVLWYTLILFCVEFKIVLYQFLYRCGHFNLSLIANQTISDSFLEMCSPVNFAHSLSKKSRAVGSWELCIICQISCDDTLSKAAKRGNVPYLKLVALGKMMSIAVFMTNLIHLIWFQLIGYNIINPAMKATQAK
jgi:hypothetical protein